MFYKVWSKLGKEHLWVYENFREKVHGIVADHGLNGSIIEYIIYETKDPISQEIFDEFEFAFEILDNYVLLSSNPMLERIKNMQFNNLTSKSPKKNYKPIQYWWQKD